MNGRPVVAPPLAPARQVPVASPLLPPVLATAPPVDRWHYWRLFCAFGVLLAGVGFVAWRGVLAGFDLALVGFGAAVAAGICVTGLGWAHRDYSAALRAEQIARGAQAQTLAAELAEWQASLEAERAVLREWSAHEHGPRRPAPTEPGPTLHPSPQEQQAAAVLARLEELTARVEALQPAPPPSEPERARYTPPTEQVTQQLDPARGLLAAAYRNGPAWKLVERAARHDTIAAGPMTTSKFRLMTDPQWRKATGALSKAGVLVQPAANQGYQLAADLDGDEVTDLHARVLDRLFDAGVGAADLPSDLPGQ